MCIRDRTIVVEYYKAHLHHTDKHSVPTLWRRPKRNATKHVNGKVVHIYHAVLPDGLTGPPKRCSLGVVRPDGNPPLFSPWDFRILWRKYGSNLYENLREKGSETNIDSCSISATTNKHKKLPTKNQSWSCDTPRHDMRNKGACPIRNVALLCCCRAPKPTT